MTTQAPQPARRMGRRESERLLAAEALADLRAYAQTQTAFAERLAGQVINHVLDVATHVFGPEPTVPLAWHVAAGAIVVDNQGAGEVWVTSTGPSASPPTGGQGVYVVPAGQIRTIAVASRQVTLYGTEGERVCVQAFSAGILPGLAG